MLNYLCSRLLRMCAHHAHRRAAEKNVFACLPIVVRHGFTNFHPLLGTIDADGCDRLERAPTIASFEGSVMVSWSERLDQAKATLTVREADPLYGKVAAAVRGMDEISTHALLDLIGVAMTSGNGRRVARTMRSLGFVTIKSRRLMPGGYRDSVTRGWSRPVRKPSFKKGGKVCHLSPSVQADEQ